MPLLKYELPYVCTSSTNRKLTSCRRANTRYITRTFINLVKEIGSYISIHLALSHAVTSANAIVPLQPYSAELMHGAFEDLKGQVKP